MAATDTSSSAMFTGPDADLDTNPFAGNANPQVFDMTGTDPNVRVLMEMMQNMMKMHAEQIQAMEKKMEEKTKQLQEALKAKEEDNTGGKLKSPYQRH